MIRDTAGLLRCLHASHKTVGEEVAVAENLQFQCKKKNTILSELTVQCSTVLTNQTISVFFLCFVVLKVIVIAPLFVIAQNQMTAATHLKLGQ